MQISKISLTICATLVGVLPGTLSAAPDNESQAKAREALEQKLHDMETQPQTNQVQVKSKKSKKAETTATAPAPAPEPAPAAAAAPAAAPVVEPAAAAAAAAPVVVTPESAPAAVPAPAAAQPAQHGSHGILYAPPADPEAMARAQEALRQKMAEIDAKQGKPGSAAAPIFATTPEVITPTPVATTSPTPASVPPAHTSNTQPKPPPHKPLTVNPAPAPAMSVQPPALPISADKHQRLEALLQKYRADQITPEQYHAERAKILAEP
jgi:hypothetical protein